MKFFLIFIMIFFHIVDDYYLQGILAKLKQKSWWQENAPDPLYKNDYKMALIMHAFSWSFMIMLPLLVYSIVTSGMPYYFHYIFCIIWNTIIHAKVDNDKANKHKINLVTDQVIHLIQIAVTYILFIL